MFEILDVSYTRHPNKRAIIGDVFDANGGINIYEHSTLSPDNSITSSSMGSMACYAVVPRLGTIVGLHCVGTLVVITSL